MKHRGRQNSRRRGASTHISLLLAAAAIISFQAASMGSSHLSASALAAESMTFGEYEIKAGFIYKFISFVAWPPAQQDRETVIIGILGKNPFGDAFQAIDGSRIGQRTVKVVFLKSGTKAEKLEGCEILYISRSEESRLEDILKDLEGRPVLTVSDTKDFADKGGIIGFVRKGRDRIGIEINLSSAARAKLTIRSMLKRIAVRIIKPEGETE